MSSEILDNKKNLGVQYYQVHEEYATRISQNPRTKGAILLGPSGKLQGGFKFMTLTTGSEIIRRSWGVILMTYTVITGVNTLGSDQLEKLIFTDRRRHAINNVEIPGVDPSEADHIKISGVDASYIAVENIKIPGVDVHIQDPQVLETIDPNIPPTNPAPIEPATVHLLDAAVDPMPTVQQVGPKLHRSSRVRTQTENYTPSVSGSKYSQALMQMESQVLLNPDAHMFVQA